jgi:hypothetical protein
MRRHLNQLATTACLLLAVSSALGQTQPPTTAIPRRQYDPIAAAQAQGQAQRQSGTTIPRSQYDPMAAAQAQGKVWQQSDTWYEFFLKRINPTDFDYGAWLEERRNNFLEASIENQYFWYSFWMTIWAVLVSTAYAKRCIDQGREQDLTDEMMADLYNHDLYSRQAARDSIAKYNRHIEQCNRVIEAVESGRPIPGSGSAIDDLNEKLNDVTAKLDAANQEKDKLQTELDAKRHITTNLSTRVEALGKQGNGHATETSGAQQSTASHSELMRELNNTQQQLYAEREKNKRLKGG